ncbi:helix-turn-helix domain-containing protein [Streptomyces sp. RB6PN25]|uniref:Helix-turn-helix domain-containing protein n=1 Tax=Streptomyces humicola TaxID=2953240 RepID=A0ABT1PX24_9ACTN|nr:helix-turn-helix transcriptional regulator [Streptomyces humicola]MCQ4082230.1 helix-turn-helix domain-containing protein [Streptomyces humicola]
MNWSTQAIRDASRTGDYGRVVRLARIAVGVSQKQLGEACGISQSAISRLEMHGTASYNMNILARAATHLQIPPRLVGLADHAAAQAAQVNGTEVERRNFLAGAAAMATAPVLAALPASNAPGSDGTQAATLRLATTAFRRMEGATPSRHLSEPVLAHLRLAQIVASEAAHDEQRARLAAVGSEVASLAGWLSWDMGDHGSARTWYGTAIKAAQRSGDGLLTAYQLGSLAQFEANTGNAAQGLNLVQSARRQIGDKRPAIAEAWLSTVEALAHAAVGDPDATDGALADAARRTDQIAVEDPPPWPWVFTFNHSKVAACRMSCGARLGLSAWVFAAQDAAGAALASGHEKQRALLVLDVASGHMAAGRLDGAFALATSAVETGLRYRSGRIVERARALRRAYTSATPPKVVRDFDARLHGVYL